MRNRFSIIHWVEYNLTGPWRDIIDTMFDASRDDGPAVLVNTLLVGMGPFALLSALFTLLTIVFGIRCKKKPESAKAAVICGRLAVVFAVLWLVLWVIFGYVAPWGRVDMADILNYLICSVPVAIVVLIERLATRRARSLLKAARETRKEEQQKLAAEAKVQAEEKAKAEAETRIMNAETAARMNSGLNRRYTTAFGSVLIITAEGLYFKDADNALAIRRDEVAKPLTMGPMGGIHINAQDNKTYVFKTSELDRTSASEAIDRFNAMREAPLPEGFALTLDEAAWQARMQDKVQQMLSERQFHADSHFSFAPGSLTVYLDNTSRRMAFAWEIDDCRVALVPYGQIVNCEIMQKAHTDKTRTRVGTMNNNTYVGTGMTSSTTWLDSLGIKFTLRDPSNPTLTIPLITKRMYAEANEVRQGIAFANRVKSSAEAAMALGKPVPPSGGQMMNPASDTLQVDMKSVTEQLKSMKELLDMGILTQEEFDAKKKQLLGL